ncbi:MAG: alpha-2-macroglobulin [Pseudomonadota bacterium]
MKHPLHPLAILFTTLIGKISWIAPPWLQWLKHHHWLTLGVLLLTAGSYLTYDHYRNLPVPLQYKAVVTAPGLARVTDEGVRPRALRIDFQYDTEAMQEVPDSRATASVARLDLLHKPLRQGVVIRPAITGEWRWADDNTLTFKPEREWPAGERYRVTLSPELFGDNVPLAEDELEFETPPFGASLGNIEFYQDPSDRRIRRVVATLNFTHAVDEQSLKQKLRLSMRPSGSGIETEAESFAYDTLFERNQRTVHIHSEPITLPERSTHMRLTLAKKVKSAHGPGSSDEEVRGSVRIPDIYSFFRVEQSDSRIVRNAEDEPEQIITIGFSDDIEAEQVHGAMAIYLLPKRHRPWQGPREVTHEVLRQSRRIEWEAIPNQRDAEKRHSLRIDVPENRQLYLRLAEGLSSTAGFKMADSYDTLLRTPAYPRELQITNEGSLLSLSGERKLGLLSRNLKAVKVSVGRVLPGQINHLISQSRGDISNPGFGYGFREENLSEYEEQIIDLARSHPKEANYAAFDLGPYLRQGGADYGLFFVTVEGWDPLHERRLHGTRDKRLILVTDLGLIVKDNADNSHDLFIQSIRSGEPVADAQVLLLGRNGQPVLRTVSDERGHAELPATEGLEREMRPTVYLVRHGNDLAFLPFDRNSRRLNFSRFDVGGVQRRHRTEDELTAFAFSDRGIYRPGDTVNLAAIVRRQDMSTPPAIPLEVELRNPRGAVVMKKRLTLPELGFLDLDYTTDATAETGQYEAAVYLIRDNRYRGQQIGSMRFAVEEFQPDRLKIKSRLLDVPEKGWIPAEGLKLEVALQNLFGTPAQNRKVSGRMVLAPTAFRFAEYEDYRFDDPLTDPEAERHSTSQPLEETTTDADGIARFTLPLQEYRQGTYRLTVNVEGFEEGGGRSVSAGSAALISPLETLVGYKADGRLGYINKDSERRIRFIAIDRQLQQQALPGLTLRLIEKQTVSTLVRQDNGTYQYQSVVKEKPLEEAPFSIADKGVDYALPTDRPGDFVLELESDKGLRLARIDFSVVGQANLDGSLEKNAELNLKLDRSDYRAGETIEMNITAPYRGSGLITIESDRVHAFKWFSSESNSSMQIIRIPEELEGNAYVNVAFVRAADSPEIFVSPLSYAAAPFTIDRSKRKVAVELEVPEIARPGKPLEIGYRASRPSRIAVFAVDEGILQVADYKTPQPLDHFLRKRALEVRTQQMLDLILPEYSLVRERAAAGGGMAEEAMARALGSNLNPFARKAQKAVAFWSGIVEAGPETQTVSFDIPESFGGQLRVMAVAVADEAMGAAQERTLVRGPFVISPNMLTVAAPGDEFLVTVGVANLVEGSGEEAAITLSAEPSEQLELLGEAQTTLTIAEGGEARAQFRLRAKQRPGPASVAFRAAMGEEESRISATLSVRPAVPYMASFQSGYAQDGQHDAGLPRKLHAALSEQQVSASASPLVLVDGLNNYLENFPHGCTEQVVSQVFPLIGLMSHPGYADRMAQTHDKVAVLIDRLRGRQLADGGFSFWPGGRTAAHFPSVYVMQFLTEARESGYAVPGDIYSRGLGYLRGVAGRGADNLESARVRAMAIYLLTRNGEVTTNDLVHLQEWLQQQQPKQWRKDLAAVYMAASYRLLKKEEEANKLVDGYTIGTGGGESYSDFHSPLTRDAQYLYLLAGHFPERLRALGAEGIRELVAPVFGGHYNTIGSAWTVLALGAYSKAVLGPVADEQIVISELVEDAAKRLAVQRRPFVTATPSLQADGVDIEGEQPLFYQITQAGFDRELPTQALIEGLEVQRDYLDSDGNAVTSLRQGAEVTVRLRIRSVGHKQLSNVAVIDLLPGGFEVIRSSVPRKSGPWRSDYVDIREDRVVFYGSFGSRVTELRYRAKLTAAGEFSVPPAYAESMYNRSLHGRSTAGSFSVAPSE